MSVDNAGTSRRVLLTTAATGAAALGVTALTGCQTYGADNGQAPPPPAGGNNPGGGAPSGGAAAALAKVADIPVGGGKVFDAQGVVVTQPAAGTIKAFSAVCTHQGCTVASVSNGTINCPCHGSSFNVADGSVASGPAARPLSAVKITVDGTDIKLS